MHFLNRRQVLRSSSLALLSPAASSIAGTGNTPASVDPNKNRYRATYSPDLAQWTQHSMARICGLHRAGKAIPSDTMEASRAVRLYANHLDDINVDRLASRVANRLSLADEDISSQSGFDSTLSTMRLHDHALTADLVTPYFQVSASEAAEVHGSILQHGISWHYHHASDLLELAAVIHAGQVKSKLALNREERAHFFHQTILRTQAESKGARLQKALYTQSSEHGFNRIDYEPFSFIGFCKKATCDLIAGGAGNRIAKFLIKTAKGMGNGLGAAEFCALDLVASGALDFVTEGAAAVATPIEAAACTEAEAMSVGGELSAEAVGSIIGTCVGMLLGHIGCP